MTITTRHAQIFGAFAALLIGGSLVLLESQTVQLERQCVQVGHSLTECKLKLRGR